MSRSRRAYSERSRAALEGACRRRYREARSTESERINGLTADVFILNAVTIVIGSYVLSRQLRNALLTVNKRS